MRFFLHLCPKQIHTAVHVYAGLAPVITHSSKGKLQFLLVRRQAFIPLMQCCPALPWSSLVGTHC